MGTTTRKPQRDDDSGTSVTERAKRRQTAVEEICAAVQVGIDSGRGQAAAAVFDRLERKYQRMSRERQR